MIRTEARMSSSVEVFPALPPRLVISLSAQNEDWSLEGTLTICGLYGKSLDDIEDELVRRLGGRCTLSIGPVQEAAILSSPDVGRCLKEFCQTWGLTAEDIVAKTGLGLTTIADCLGGRRRVRFHTRRVLASTVDRITQRPTVGEYLRYRRVKTHHSLRDAALAVGVSGEAVSSWERDKIEVPEEKRWVLMNLYGMAKNIWGNTPSVRDMMAPVTATTPPPWGSWSRKHLATAKG